jgi:putative SOS response-associated peptidase YedK
LVAGDEIWVKAKFMRVSHVPYWWKKPLKQAPATFNARAETVASTPMFRDAFKRHRCIVPASGYYEWLKMPDGKQPYFFSAADRGVLSFAGLWDTGGRIPGLASL